LKPLIVQIIGIQKPFILSFFPLLGVGKGSFIGRENGELRIAEVSRMMKMELQGIGRVNY